MTEQEREIEKLESTFPAISAQAFAEARRRVLESGQSVLQTEGEFLVRVHPDGRKEVVKKVEPPVHTKIGTIITLE
jgi:hypothetical protein